MTTPAAGGRQQRRDDERDPSGSRWAAAAVLAWSAGLALGCAAVAGPRLVPGCEYRGERPRPRCVDEPPLDVAWASMIALVGWMTVTAAIAAVAGWLDSRRHRRFAAGSLAPALLVTVAAPWAMAAYGLAYGLGRTWRRPPTR